MSSEPDLLSFITVKINGSEVVGLAHDLLEATVENSLHQPSVATLLLHDTRLYWIDDASLVPGATLQIWVDVSNQKKQLFDGEIVEVEPDFASKHQYLTVRAFDRLHRLTRGRYARSFVNVSDQDLVSRIARELDLQTQIDPTSEVYPYVFQNNETNLEFLQRRAAALGYLLYVRGKTLYCVAPRSDGTTIDLKWLSTMHEFRPRLTTLGQVDDVAVRGWNPATKEAVVGGVKTGNGAPKIGVSSDGGAFAQKAFHITAQDLVTDYLVRSQTHAHTLAQAIANRHASNFIEAEGSCGGNPALLAGVSVNITAVGKRFSGTYFVTNTVHTYNSKKGYITQFSASGLNPTSVLSLLLKERDNAAGLQLAIGIVTDNKDPLSQGRVKVRYPWLSDRDQSDWARVMAPGGGNKRGVFFLPEVNDEVLVGFEQGDIHYPYVLGGLWNGKDELPKRDVVGGDKVQQRVIYSRSGHMLIFDDNSAGGGITLQDSKGNKVVLDAQKNAITIESQGNATLNVTGNLTLQANGNMDLQAKGNMSLQATGNITLDAKAQTQVKGMGGVQVEAGIGIVNVKGSMINLN